MRLQLVDTVSSLKDVLETFPAFGRSRPDLYIDLEGNNLWRHGTLSLVTIFVESHQTVYLIDVTTLRSQAFSVTALDGRNIKTILESDQIIKVFFDIRNDSDALFSHCGISVQGIEDVQLMELATRNASKRLVNGLAKCIQGNSDIGFQDQREWGAVKGRGQQLFKFGKDGYAIFDKRPLPSDVLEYCVQDVTFLPKLRDSYRAKLCNASWLKVQEETLARIRLSQGCSYNGKGRHMALGPPSWQNWSPSWAQRQERDLLVEGKDEKEADSDSPLGKAGAAPAGKSSDEKPVITGDAPLTAGKSYSSDEEDFDERRWSASHWSRGFDVREESPDHPKDLTACDSECGYCGQCMY